MSSAPSFASRLDARVAKVGAPVCVGLDPHFGQVPGTTPEPTDPHVQAQRIHDFCRIAIDAVADIAAMVKPQAAFFEALGAPGVAVLQQVCAYARDAGLMVLLDAKRGDIGSTALAYARATLHPDGPMAADAVTLSPYLGPEGLAPFLNHADAGKGCFVLVRTSNRDAAPWQVDGGIAERVAAWIAERPESVGAVVGATLQADEVARWRAAMPDSWLLVPGFGAQGADGDALRPFFTRPRALIAASRSVLFGRTGDGTTEADIRSRAQQFQQDVLRVRG